MGAASGPDMITDGLVLCLDAGSRESYPVSFPSNGLYGRRYVGYFNDNVNWFETATLHGDVNQLTAIDNFTSNADLYSWQWTGYFKPSTTENYTFFTSSDDASYLWIGDNATAGFTTANANVNNAGLHGNQERSSTPVSLTKGVYYPIRIQFGENGGGDIMSVSFSTPTISKTRNGLGYYYHGLTTQNTWKDLSNNGNNGTLTNGPLFSEDNIGSLLFDGVNDYVELNTNNIITATNPFTFEAFYKVINISQNAELFGNFGSGYESNTIWFSGRYGVYMNGVVRYFQGYPLGAGTYHMAFTRTSTGDCILYKNGIVDGTATSTISISVGQNFRIGSDVNGLAELFGGNLYNLKVYNRALTPAEIQQNYNAIKGRFGI